jgi:hypothetical protein
MLISSPERQETQRDEASTMTLIIDHVLYATDLGDLGMDETAVDAYARKLEAAISAEYPQAEVDVPVKTNVTGVGSGSFVAYDDDEYHADVDLIRAHVDHIAETVLTQV